MSERRNGWLAAAGQIVGNLDEWETVYTWDGSLHPTRKAAIKYGFEVFGHDDFNIGRVDTGALAWWGWMGEEHPDEDRESAARSLGLDATS